MSYADEIELILAIAYWRAKKRWWHGGSALRMMYCQSHINLNRNRLNYLRAKRRLKRGNPRA